MSSSSSTATKPITWIGPMNFDVQTARLQYSRVLVGHDELPVNVGDTVLFETAQQRSNVTTSSSSQTSSPSNSNMSIPPRSSTSFSSARILHLWHNPRGKIDRIATVNIFTHLIAPHPPNTTTTHGKSVVSSASSNQSILQDQRQLLSRFILKLDEVPKPSSLNNTNRSINNIIDDGISNNGNSAIEQPHQLTSSSSVSSSSNMTPAPSSPTASAPPYQSMSTNLASVTNVEIPLSTIEKKVEIRELDECGACVPCFLRHTPGIFASSNSSASTSPSSSQQQQQQQSCVVVTDIELRQAVVSFNSKAKEFYSQEKTSEKQQILAKLVGAKSRVEERLETVLKILLSSGRGCASCEIVREPHQNDQSIIETLKRDILPRLLLHVYMTAADIAGSHRQQPGTKFQKPQQEEREEKPATMTKENTTSSTSKTTTAVDEVKEKSGTRRQRSEETNDEQKQQQPSSDPPPQPQEPQGTSNEKEVGQDLSKQNPDPDHQHQLQDHEEQNNTSQEVEEKAQQPEVMKKVFEAPSLVAAGIDVRLLRVDDASKFRLAVKESTKKR